MTITIPDIVFGYASGVGSVWVVLFVFEMLGWRFRKDTTKEGDTDTTD